MSALLNSDYKDILQALLDSKVRFLVVGAYAMGVYGYVRATGDFDVWVEPSAENSRLVYRALADFGAPMEQLKEDTFKDEGVIFQVGVEPRRIDIISKISGLSFMDAYSRRVNVELDGLAVPFLSKVDLIKNKESTDREQDKLDAKHLRELK